MRAGPKKSVATDAPLYMDDLPPGGGDRVAAFVRKYLSPPKGAGHGRPLVLRDWQVEICKGLFDEPRPRSGLLAIPRANGKSTLAAALGIYALFGDNEPSPQVVLVATTEKQASITFEIAYNMVLRSKPLHDRCLFYRDKLVVPATGGTLTVLPAEESSLQGFDPSFAVVDEIGYVPNPVYEAVMGASGKREHSMVLAIGTPGPDRDASPMWSMVQRGRNGAGRSFYFREWSAPPSSDPDDESVWAAVNPAYGDFLWQDAMKAARVSLRTAEFMRFRMGAWVGESEQWLGYADWDACADADREFDPAEPHVLAFDGSFSGDSTAIVASTLDGHIHLRALWENPGDDRWRVPREEVDLEVEVAFTAPGLIAMYCDPWGWQTELETWASRYGETKVIEFPSNQVRRMAPASDRFYAAVQDGALTHDGNKDLARHITNCVAKSTPIGDVITKEKKSSRRKIDAAVCAVIAYDRALWHAAQPRKRGSRWKVVA